MSDEHRSFIKTPKQLVIVVILAFAVPIALIALLSQLVTGLRPAGSEDAETGVLDRIKPVGEITQADASAPQGGARGEPAGASFKASAATASAPVRGPALAATTAAAPAAIPAAAPAAATKKLGAPLDLKAGEALMQKDGCAACHAVDKKIVGPAFQEVTAKYKGDAGAPAKLARKVKAGGAGAWGQVPMPPNPQVPDEDIKALVSWILTLKK